MTLALPAEIPVEEFEGWLGSLRRATGMPLVVTRGAGAKISANGETIAVLDLAAAASPEEEARIEEAARILTRLSEDKIARRDLVTQMARLWKEQNFLTSVATALTAQATPEETADRLLGRIIRLLGVRRASILLARPDGRLIVAAAEGLAAILPAGSVVPEGGVANRVFQTGEPILVEDLSRVDPAELGGKLHGETDSNSFLSVPILSNGVPVGVINVTDRTAGKPFHAEDKKLVGALAAQLGIAFANVKLLEEARRAEALQRELDLAARIQRSLFPRGPYAIAGFDIFGRCEPAAWVGGDSFEIAPRPGGGLWAAVLDVSGHGISAALLMASTRAALKALIGSDDRPSEVAAALNALVQSEAGDTGMFLTGALARVDADGSARFCSLGHPPALVRRSGGSLQRFGEGGPPAGVVEGVAYAEDVTRLLPGDALLLFTDGLTEADGGSGEFGDAGVAASFQREPERGAEQAAQDLFRAVYDHLRGQTVRDDVTVLVVCREVTR